MSGGLGCSGGCQDRWFPGVARDGLARWGHDVSAVLAGGVDVAADIESVLGDLFVGEPTGDFLLGLGGSRVAFAEVVCGPDPGVEAETEDVVLTVAAELQ